MTAVARDGHPSQESGSRARSRELGYAQAMYEVWKLIADLRSGPLDAYVAFNALSSYAHDTFYFIAQRETSPVDMALLGNWETEDGWIVTGRPPEVDK